MDKHIWYDGMEWGLNTRGYYRRMINYRYIQLHQYIYEKYNGPVPKGLVIHHKDHNKTNNDINNLIVITPTEHSHIHHLNHKHTEESKKKISKKLKGKIFSLETREKIRQSKIGKRLINGRMQYPSNQQQFYNRI